MKRFAFIVMVVMALAACNRMEENHVVIEEPIPVEVEGVVMDVPLIPFAAETKTQMTVGESGLSFLWSNGDQTGVYSSKDGFALYRLTEGEGTSSATFDGGGFLLADGDTYYSFYPYASAATEKKAIPVDFTGQTLTQNDDTKSPMSKDYMYASAVASNGNALFHYKHIGSFVRTRLFMQTATEVESVDFIPMYSELTQTATVDVTADRDPLTPVTTNPRMVLELADVEPTDNYTLWSVMAPQDLSADNEAVAIVARSGSDLYSARVKGQDLQAGKAYRWDSKPVPSTGYDHGLTASVKTAKLWGEAGNTNQYSAITWLGSNQYAVVHDKEKGGGIVLFEFAIDSEGNIGDVKTTVPSGTSESGTTGMDNEGIAYYDGFLYVSAESDQSIRKYDLTGAPLRFHFPIPEDMGVKNITPNAGFEALTYNAGLFWTTTEAALPKDNYIPRLHRLQSFTEEGQPAGRYLYQMDAPAYSKEGTKQYVYGISAMAALDDGRLIVLEREVYVPSNMLLSSGIAKLYVVDPVHDTAGILQKGLLTTITTNAFNLANYEGMCLGPMLRDGSRCLILISDAQGTAFESLQVVTIQ